MIRFIREIVFISFECKDIYKNQIIPFSALDLKSFFIFAACSYRLGINVFQLYVRTMKSFLYKRLKFFYITLI